MLIVVVLIVLLIVLVILILALVVLILVLIVLILILVLVLVVLILLLILQFLLCIDVVLLCVQISRIYQERLCKGLHCSLPVLLSDRDRAKIIEVSGCIRSHRSHILDAPEGFLRLLIVFLPI